MFGRGGEEALALTAAGIPVEVVPGVSAAVAAPALAGIPVTHRGVSTAFVVVAGHAEEAYRPVLEGLHPHTATIVVMMGLARMREIAAVLVERGWKFETPVAVLLGASKAGAETLTTTLGDLARGIGLMESDHPGTIVIGEVVRLRALLGIGRGESVAQPFRLRVKLRRTTVASAEVVRAAKGDGGRSRKGAAAGERSWL